MSTIPKKQESNDSDRTHISDLLKDLAFMLLPFIILMIILAFVL